ncbi:MAG: DUF4835 family protein, partial [Bacteroidota bacterium]|nr:DUF4835 family protein [Bacteroidota bacterium]
MDEESSEMFVDQRDCILSIDRSSSGISISSWKRILLTIGIWLTMTFLLPAQELKCRVQINTQQISGTDKSVYDNFKTTVETFMNTQQWSSLQLSNVEKIDCSLMFIFKKTEGTSHTCDLQIQSSRPVYGTTLTTSLLNIQEEITFDYQENQVLTFNETNIDNNLTATLAFWSYIILGLDFDSFSKLGGTPFFQKAQEVVGLSQGSLGELWKAQQDKNHWGWANALSDDNQTVLRNLSYTYHRLALDDMYENADKGRAQITQALAALKTAKQNKPRSPLLTNFIQT